MKKEVKNHTFADVEKVNYGDNKSYLKIRVQEPDFLEALLWWQKRGLMYTTTGYGKKLPTTKKIRFEGRLRRVYCCIYSNIGTCYICTKKYGDIIVD